MQSPLLFVCVFQDLPISTGFSPPFSSSVVTIFLMALQLTWFHHTSPLNIRWVETVSCGAKSELPAGGGIIPPKGFSFLLLRSFLCPPSDFNNFCLTIQSTRPVVTFLFLHLFIRSFPGTVVFRIIQMTRSDGKLFVPW